MTPSNVLTEWARLLLATLEHAGIHDVVMSPGSRSTPFACAALARPGLTCHSIIDERSAAFFALGQARVLARPSLLICTSGTAAANYFPAVVEGACSGVPLVVLSADRPFELQDGDAPQTIDQTKLYGDHVRAFVDLGMPSADIAALRALTRRAARAVWQSVSPDPGPVHLNARAGKPLEPVSASGAGLDLARAVDELITAGPTRAASRVCSPEPSALDALTEAMLGAERGLIVCGPLPPGRPETTRAIAALAEASGCALYAEAASQLRFGLTALGETFAPCDALGLLLSDTELARACNPDFVLEIGAPATSGSWERFVSSHPRLTRHVIAERGWPDSHGSARAILFGEPGAVARALEERLREHPPPQSVAFRASLARENQRIQRALDDLLESEDRNSEAAAVRAVVESLPSGALLCVGNSLPIRALDWFCASKPAGLHVVTQRGANGIDGLVSGAAGSATAAMCPTVLLLGDVSFLHDLGGLAAARTVASPFAIVVLDNGGGQIFHELPLADALGRNSDAMRYFVTPHGLDLALAGPLFQIGTQTARSTAELRSALTGALEHTGPSLIVVRPHGSVRQTLAHVRERVRRGGSSA
jgi:2-succinyl-5-enolpyruvyl-6-hydroxy-3-cyclohexene-1-carboxylate synthase